MTADADVRGAAVTRSLHRKLAEVMAEVGRIPKRGKAPPEMGGYPFVQVGDAADAIRKALGERRITMLPTALEIIGQSEHETPKGRMMQIVEIRQTWTLTDGDSGESIAIQSYGVGADTGDKYSGKAQTNAMKYALLMAFLLSTGDDPELGSDERAKGGADREKEVGPLPPITIVDREWSGEGAIAIRPKGPSDGLMRQDQDGSSLLMFAFDTGTESIPQVVAAGTLADDINDASGGGGHKLHGLRATLHGMLEEVPWEKVVKKGEPPRRMPPFKRLVLQRMVTADWELPEPILPVAEGQESLLSDEELAALI